MVVSGGHAQVDTEFWFAPPEVRALENGGPSESWSTALTLEFEHNITIPNIITPNGDEFNQYFNISKIELYKQSDLTILDRWGKQIYHVIHYQNDWDGNGLSSGVYYYMYWISKGMEGYIRERSVF